MKTVLFFFTDLTLQHSVCEAFITPASNVEHLISWKSRCLQREVKEGFISSFDVRVLDKINLSMIQTA